MLYVHKYYIYWIHVEWIAFISRFESYYKISSYLERFSSNLLHKSFRFYPSSSRSSLFSFVIFRIQFQWYISLISSLINLQAIVYQFNFYIYGDETVSLYNITLIRYTKKNGIIHFTDLFSHIYSPLMSSVKGAMHKICINQLSLSQSGRNKNKKERAPLSPTRCSLPRDERESVNFLSFTSIEKAGGWRKKVEDRSSGKSPSPAKPSMRRYPPSEEDGLKGVVMSENCVSFAETARDYDFAISNFPFRFFFSRFCKIDLGLRLRKTKVVLLFLWIMHVSIVCR